ncbi:hypothetical protein C9I57_10280 [Trinickia symbiotica]|uniref:Uncharacterized protein n=1 Tax=Trinickia symbiotica TaxID=863227 RepID=A0A2T3XX55_9BURK|nr:hypothetical protein C9I57_10280 [Trinickia symbiotica]
MRTIGVAIGAGASEECIFLANPTQGLIHGARGRAIVPRGGIRARGLLLGLLSGDGRGRGKRERDAGGARDVRQRNGSARLVPAGRPCRE